jgi:hypothetical protein
VSKNIEQVKYFERLNISVTSIAKAKKLIKTNIINTITCWDKGINVDKQTFHIIGPAGIGKSQICEQIADELSKETGKNFNKLMIKCPVLSRDDFLIPFPVTKDGKSKFEMLYSNFVPDGKDTYGIFIIDEFSRGDHSLQQLMWQIQNDYKVHLRDLPKGWFVIAVDNPDDQEYNMNILEDAAGLRRMLHLYVDVDAKDFLDHAIEHNYHPFVIDFIQAHPEYLYDFDSQKMGAVYANPASYEKLSNILLGYDSVGGTLENLIQIEPLASGLLNISKTRLFMDFLKEQCIIKPKDIFMEYDKVRTKIKQYVKQKHNAKLGEIVVALTTYLSTSKPKYTDKELNNVIDFLTDVPIDTSAIFCSQIDNLDRNDEAFKYVSLMHAKMNKMSEKYREKFYEAMIKASGNDQ